MHLTRFLTLGFSVIAVHTHPLVHQLNTSAGTDEHCRRANTEIENIELNRITYQHCTNKQILILAHTASTAFDITRQMTIDFNKDNPYVQAFWPKNSFSDAWMAYGKKYYFLMATKLRINNMGYSQPTFICTQCDNHPGWVAYTVTEADTISFCPNFFSDFKDVEDLPCVDGKPLGEYDARGMIYVSDLNF